MHDYSEPASTAKSHRTLSPPIAYYLRKLLRQNFDRLQSVVATGAGVQADPLSDLNVVIDSLYLEDQAIQETVLKLERLALSHQALSTQSAIHRQQLSQLEQEIFWLLGFKQHEVKAQGTILIVDDAPDNLRLLSAALTQQGYDVRSAINGSMALSNVKTIQPDLILLDVTMPGMTGYEVCDRLKSNEQTRDIPVIFVSAIDAPLDKVRAFKSGSVDYITKPFQIEEVVARIEHQLKIGSLQKRLEEQNARLQKEIQDRTRAEQTATQALTREREFYGLQSRFAEVMSCEFRKPLSLIQSSIERLQSPKYSEAERQNYYRNLHKVTQHLLQVLDDLLALERSQTDRPAPAIPPYNLLQFCQQFIADLQRTIPHPINITNDRPFYAVQLDFKLLRLLFRTLLMAFIRSSTKESTIELKFSCASARVVLHVQIQQSKISAPEQDLFENFSNFSRSQLMTGSGLELTIVKSCLSRLGGSISTEQQLQPQVPTYVITLPLASQPR